MHGTIFILKEKPEWLDEYELFEGMNREWPGIDYVDTLTEEDSLERVKSYENDSSYPEFRGKSIIITEKSEHDRNQARKRKIKELSDQVVKEDTGEYLLRSLLEGEPYGTYICYPEEDHQCMLTLDTFLRTAEEGIYEIVGVMDYHC